MSRLQHMVFDDLHLMNENIDSLKYIWSICCSKSIDPQLIITSLYWKNNLTNILEKCNNPLLCISSYIEAAYYAKTSLKLVFSLQEHKLEEMTSEHKQIYFC